jgi:hypothetical protein
MASERRVAWESELAFTSLRSIYEEVMTTFHNGELIDQVLYSDVIGFDKEVPYILHHSLYISSILDRNGVVSLHGMLGSISDEGCYWVKNGTLQDVNNLKRTKVHDVEKGLFSHDLSYFQNNGRACTSGIPNSFQQTGLVQNGDARGSSRLEGSGSYFYVVSPANGSGTLENVRATFRMRGFSYRKGRRRWKLDRSDHIFSWDMTVNRQVVTVDGGTVTVMSETFTNYSGQETHNNNQEAAKEIVIEDSNRTAGYSNTNRLILDVIVGGTSGGGTKHSTSALSPIRINYSCS